MKLKVQIIHTKVFKTILVGILALILIFATALPRTQAIDISTTAKKYAMDVPFYQEDCSVKINGTYKKSPISDGCFDGCMDLEGVHGLDAETDTVHLAFRRNIATPIIKHLYGPLHTSEIYSVVRDRNLQYAIIVLYNKYQVSNHIITGSFDSRTAKFICIGDVTRKQAIEILTQWYSLD